MTLQKNHIQIIAILVAGILIGSIVFVLSASYNKNKNSVPLTTLPPSPQTSAVTTTEPQTTTASKETTENVSDTQKDEQNETSKEETTKSAELSVPTGKTAIINAYVEAVNKLKNTNDFTLVLQEDLKINIDDITGGSSAKNLVQKLIDQNAKENFTSYKFVGGIDSKGSTPGQIIAPKNVTASLSPGNVVSATAKKESNKTYKVKIFLGKQIQTFDVPAPGYSTITHIIDASSLKLPTMVSISQLNATYNNSSIEAIIDADGKIISMTHTVEVPSAQIDGKITLAPVALKVHGTLKATYEITY